MCEKNIQEIKLELSMNEIKAMTKAKFTIILKKKIRDAALEYLLKKQGKKGGEIKYSGIEMASYLQPFSSALTISEQGLRWTRKLRQCTKGSRQKKNVTNCGKSPKGTPRTAYNPYFSIKNPVLQ